MPDTVILTFVAGPKEGEVLMFDTHDTLLFGRVDDCHICLPEDEQVSRHHFILEMTPPNARLRDLGSRNGTYINGQKYGGREKHETPEEGARRKHPQVDLHDGDEIQVGKTILRIKVEVTVIASASMGCQRCGKDASIEIGPGQQGDYVCEACRQQVSTDPTVLAAMFLHEAQDNVNIPISDYQFERLLGEGGMGAVYLVRHSRHNYHAALKVMISRVAVNDYARDMFLREIETTRVLRHPHIVEFLESGAAGSIFYFLLEYCAGGSVHDLMQRRGGRLLLDEAGSILLQALEGLAFAHQQGFVHRDLKPNNILLSGGEGQWSAKIADLGLAKNFEQAGFSGMTVTGDFAGSYPFMPREQVINFKYTKPVSDVWSMGATCYYMLTGHHPRLQQPGRDPLDVILNSDIIPIRQRDPSIPPHIAEVIDHSLANKVQDRYQNASEMHEAFVQALTTVKKKNPDS